MPLRTGLTGIDQISILTAPVDHDDDQIDLVHGCVVLSDIIADIVADVAIDAAVDAAADAVVDAAADGAADAAATEGCISAANISRLKTLGLLLGGAVLGAIVDIVYKAIKNAVDDGGQTSSAADYWNALYNEMVKDYPCDLPASQACPTNFRNAQELMVGRFLIQLSEKQPTAATAAATFQKIWSAADEQALKTKLGAVAATGGIPSMLKVMAGYMNPSCSGAALVIATAQTVVTVAAFEYTG